MPSAIETMKDALQNIQQAMVECCNDRGFIKDECRARYNILVSKARAFHEAIEFMEDLYVTSTN